MYIKEISPLSDIMLQSIFPVCDLLFFDNFLHSGFHFYRFKVSAFYFKTSGFCVGCSFYFSEFSCWFQMLFFQKKINLISEALFPILLVFGLK